MPRYEFSVGSADRMRRAGIVTSEDFNRALEAIAQQAEVEEGDILEIGVRGFPPAKFEYVWSLENGSQIWRPTLDLAA